MPTECLETNRENDMKRWITWDERILIIIYAILLCVTVVLLAKDFVGIVTDLWFGFDDVMMEFGRVIEQLPI
jgi:hypothetical protein